MPAPFSTHSFIHVMLTHSVRRGGAERDAEVDSVKGSRDHFSAKPHGITLLSGDTREGLLHSHWH